MTPTPHLPLTTTTTTPKRCYLCDRKRKTTDDEKIWF